MTARSFCGSPTTWGALTRFPCSRSGIPAAGTFPKLLRIGREHGIGLETLANRLAALPAQTYRLGRRGRILEGYAADLVLLDPGEVRDAASFDRPEEKPLGIRRVFVNGRTAAADGRVTGVLAGVPVRRE